MSDAFGDRLFGTGDYPNYMSAFSKTPVGWLEPTRIVADGVYTIAPQETTQEVYRIDPPGCRTGEYFLIEMRRRYLWDQFLMNQS